MTTMFAGTHTESTWNMSHFMPCDVQWLETSCIFCDAAVWDLVMGKVWLATCYWLHVVLPGLHVILDVTLDMFCAISALCIVVFVGITAISWTTVPSMSWCESATRITANMSKSFSFILWHHFWWHSSEAMSAPGVPHPRGSLATAESLRSTLRERFSTNLSSLNIKNTCSLVISGSSPDLSVDECLWWI